MKRLTRWLAIWLAIWLASALAFASGTALAGTNADALFAAVSAGDVEEVRALLDKGADVNAKDKYARTPLIVAAEGTSPVSVKLVPLWKEGEGQPHVAKLLRRYARLPHSRRQPDKGAPGSFFGLLTSPDSSPEMVKLLLQRGADVNAKDDKGVSALMVAIYPGNSEVVELLLEKGADMSAQDAWGGTALMDAIDDDVPELAELMLRKGADVNAKGKYGRTPLMAAIQSVHPGIARLLVSMKADVNAHDNAGVTPLIMAVGGTKDVASRLRERERFDAYTKTGSIAVPPENAARVADTVFVKLLLDNGADVNATNDRGETALMAATQAGAPAAATLLLDKRADVNAADARGETALMKAIDSGNTEIVELLLNHGANLNTANVQGRTPLMAAVASRHAAIVKLLLDKGADAKSTLRDGTTVLQLAMRRGGADPEIVRLLLDKGADVNAMDVRNGSAWDDAMRFGNVEIMKLMLAHGADANAHDRSGGTALSYAICNNQPDLIEFLLDHGADVNLQTNGQTPLLESLKRPIMMQWEQPTCQGFSNPKIVELLLKKGADPNAEGRSHETPLLQTVRGKNYTLVDLLLRYGAEANPPNPDGRITPLIEAIHTAQQIKWVRKSLRAQGFHIDEKEGEKEEDGNAQVIKLLRDKGADIDVKDRNGQTALMRAAQRGDAQEAELLLQYGADPALRDAQGQTALDIARQSKRSDVITLLESRKP